MIITLRLVKGCVVLYEDFWWIFVQSDLSFFPYIVRADKKKRQQTRAQTFVYYSHASGDRALNSLYPSYAFSSRFDEKFCVEEKDALITIIIIIIENLKN